MHWLRAYSIRMIASLCLVGSASAGSDLIRLTDRDDLFLWEAVGRLEIGQDGYCTGVLISPDLVLTAAHCVYDRQGQLRSPKTIRFRAGLTDNNTLADRSISRIAAHKEYNPTQRIAAQTIRYDVALLELANPISTSIADPFQVHQGAGKGQRVSVVSYGRGRDEALSWQRDCAVLGRGQGLIAFDCSVTFGSSGAPVFVREHGKTRILTLISGGVVNGPVSMAYGMDLPPLVDRLKKDLRSMPKPNATQTKLKRVKVGEGGSASGAKFAKP